MKVVIFHPPLYPVNHILFEELGKYLELVVYSFGNHPKLHKQWLTSEFKEKAKNYRIEILNDGSTSLKAQFNYKALISLYKEKPDVVMSIAFWIPSLYSSLLKNIFNFKFIIITDAILITEKDLTRNRVLLRRLICANTDAVISASNLTSEYIRTLNKKVLIKKSLQTIDLTYWNSILESLPDKIELRSKLNLPKNKTIMLSVGGFIDLKNWDIVFQYMKELKSFHYVLIGSGSLKDKYLEYIKKNELDAYVSVIDRKEGIELIEYYKASDLFIFPSLKDTFGYVVAEALASGLPVICSNQAGASSLIVNDYNGYVINPTEDFKNAILLTSKNIKKMSINSKFTIDKFTMENKALEYLDICNKIQNNKGN